MYSLASREAERMGDPNRAENLKYKSKAKFNRVKDIPSFFREIKYRWKSNPYLGGKEEYSPLTHPSMYRSYNFKEYNDKIK